MTEILAARTPDGAIDREVIRRAADVIRKGGLVAFPTETVYGLGANALDPLAVRRIFEAKGRPAFNPLIVHVARPEEVRRLSASWPREVARLADTFWPGPLTLVLPRSKLVPDEVTGGLDSVALRAPAHPVARALILEADLPIAAPSANPYMGVSPTSAAHVASGLDGKVDLILDDGATPVGIESTVLDCTGDEFRLLRPGGLAASALERLVGSLLRVSAAAPDEPRLSPGMHARHYAPRGQASLVDEADLASALAALGADARVGVVAQSSSRPADSRIVVWDELGEDPETYARALYASLHRMDEAGATHVLLIRPPNEDDAWEAVRDRLTRATGRE